MQVRSGGAPGHANLADHLSARDRITDLHHLFALVQIAGRDPVTVIENGETAFKIVIGPGERDARGRWCRNRRAGGCCDIHPEMRFHRLAVQDALAAERAADDTRHGPIELVHEPVCIGVGHADRGDHRDLPLAALEYLGRQSDKLFRQSGDALDFVLSRNGLKQPGFARAVGIFSLELRWPCLIIGEAECEIAVRRNVQRRVIEQHMAARFHFADDETSLLKRAKHNETRSPGKNGARASGGGRDRGEKGSPCDHALRCAAAGVGVSPRSRNRRSAIAGPA